MYDIDHVKTTCTSERLVTEMPDGAPAVISTLKKGESFEELVVRHEAEIRDAFVPS